jgi:hypothetical protein
MNQEINTAFDYALLARAAYADLSPRLTMQQAVDILTNNDNKWSLALATYFLSKFTVVASELSGFESYQGVFFKRVGTEEYILARVARMQRSEIRDKLLTKKKPIDFRCFSPVLCCTSHGLRYFGNSGDIFAYKFPIKAAQYKLTPPPHGLVPLL